MKLSRHICGGLLLLLTAIACGNTQQATQSSGGITSPSTGVTIAGTGVAVPGITPSIHPTMLATTTTSVSMTATADMTITPGPGEFENPVIAQDFPDPDTLKVGTTYYAYATNGGGKNIQAGKSTDLVHWTMLNDPLPTLPAWSQRGFTWAPEVSTGADDHHFVMYFVARDTASNKQCIGAATADTPEGPFTSSNPKPLICQLEQGGSIDPESFTDNDGSRYVVWKNDGNCCGMDTYLYVQKASRDGLTLEGTPTKLIHEDQGWEGNLVEAPFLWKHGNKYYLFYSANNYAGAAYAVGYAVADSLLGPYHKPNDPLLKTTTEHGPVIGPGGEDILTTPDGKNWIVYHSWDPTISVRQMNIDELDWQGDTPVVKGPYRSPEPVPLPQP
ncbi:MAG: family 43 glycosylhydrolase [Herpetosiphonaceae bacterium]|nr:family 43 glycosylhydrolase [Herpetosiphonaceae bacterium]